jgi:hypothetical protein
MEKRTTGLVLIAVGLIGLLAMPLYAGLAWSQQAGYGPSTMGQWPWQRQAPPPAPITLDEAKTIAQQYLVSLGNPNLAIKEIMEFQYNFYIMYYEKDTGLGAFEMLIWKQAPPQGMMGGGMGMGGGMMGRGMITGAIMPEPGPNMMWNTKYSMMRGMMGSRSQAGASSEMQVSEQGAKSIAESYLSQNFPGAHVEGVTRFYGYYTIDFEKDGKIIGMLSVNGFTGEVWYHSWHGYFIQEKDFS